MKLYFDIGNSNTKLNVVNVDGEHYFVFPNKKITNEDKLYHLLPNFVKNKIIKKILICSVSTKKLKILTSMITKKIKKHYKILDYKNFINHLNLRYVNESQIGTDILALSLFISNKTNNGIIINMGTSITITHVKDKTIMGVIIMPGLNTSIKSLIKNAEKLRGSNFKLIKGKILGSNTSEAISGGLWSYVYSFKQYTQNIDNNAKIYLSGGDSPIIKEYFKNCTHIEQATIKGMMLI